MPGVARQEDRSVGDLEVELDVLRQVNARILINLNPQVSILQQEDLVYGILVGTRRKVRVTGTDGLRQFPRHQAHAPGLLLNAEDWTPWLQP